MRCRLLPLLLWCLLASAPGRGESVREYGFPFTDPLQATVIGTPSEFQADLPEGIPFQMREIRVLPKPVVAMVAGYAVGGGHVLHLVCDLTIAADNAIFGQTGPKVGSFDGGYGSSHMARIVGQKKARETIDHAEMRYFIVHLHRLLDPEQEGRPE